MISHHRCCNERDPRAALPIARDRPNLVNATTTNATVCTTPTSQNAHAMNDNAYATNRRNMNDRAAVTTSILNAACGKTGSSPTINRKICELQQAPTSLQEEIGEIAYIPSFIYFMSRKWFQRSWPKDTSVSYRFATT